MAFTSVQILELLDADEPRYAAVAAMVAGDGFDALTALAQSPDLWSAARPLCWPNWPATQCWPRRHWPH